MSEDVRLTAKQREALVKHAEKFKSDMQKLGLGVSISVGGGPMVRIVDPPDEKPKDAA